MSDQVLAITPDVIRPCPAIPVSTQDSDPQLNTIAYNSSTGYLFAGWTSKFAYRSYTGTSWSEFGDTGFSDSSEVIHASLC